MSKSVTCNTLVWLRDKPFEAGTTFSVVEQPDGEREVDPATAAGWERNGWLVVPKPAKGKTSAASEGA